MRPTSLLLLFAIHGVSWAAETKAPPTPSAALAQIAYGLIAVLALMFVAAWLFKKIGPIATGNKIPVKVVGGTSLGNRERVMVIEVGDQWIVVGVTATQINTLATMQKQEGIQPEHIEQADAANPNQFAMWLRKKIDKQKNGDV
jgi:flagellar protein FliO/FliZ